MPTDPSLQEAVERALDPVAPDPVRDEALARLAGREHEALPAVFARLRAADDPAAVQAAARILRRWAPLPLADALPRALNVLLDEPEVGDLNKLAAAALLDSLGRPVDEADLARRLADPRALQRAALARLLDGVARPAALVRALESLGDAPRDVTLALIDDLTASGRAAALALLVPLTHAADADVAVSAAGALETLGAAAAQPALAAVAAHHADATTRREAARAVTRLSAAAVGAPGDDGPARGEPSAWWQATPSGGAAGDRLILLVGPVEADGTRDALTLLVRPGGGIVHTALAAGLDEAEVGALRARFAAGGAPLSAAEPAAARAALEVATAETLAHGAARGIAWAAWRHWWPRGEG